MDTALAQFSDWTLAILPRLFLYPGGLWALLALLWLRFVSGGPQALKPRILANALLRSHLPAAAIAWVALALLPLPGTAALPFPVDRFAQAGLLLTSLLVGQMGVGTGRDESRPYGPHRGGVIYHALPLYASVTTAMLLAVMAPIAGGRALLPSEAGSRLSDWASLAAVGVGLLMLSAQAADLESDLRWLAWLGLGASPLLTANTQTLLPGILWVSLFYALSIGAIVGAGRLPIIGRLRGWLEATCWGLAALSLLLALLA